MAMEQGFGNLVAGILSGMQQGQRQKELDKIAAEERKMKQKLVDFELKENERKAKKDEFMMNMIAGVLGGGQQQQGQQDQQGQAGVGYDQGGNSISVDAPLPFFGQQQGSTVATPSTPQNGTTVSMSGPGSGGGLADMLANMDPQTAMAMEYLGLPIGTALRMGSANETKRSNAASEEMARKNYDLSKQRMEFEKGKVEYKDTGTGFVGFTPTGAPAGMFSKPVGSEAKNFMHKETGQPPPPNMTYDELLAPGSPYASVPEKQTVESAGKVATAKSGISAIQQARSLIVKEDGTVDRKIVASMQRIPGVGIQGVPFTKGRELRSNYWNALDAKVRAMTGAAITKDEQPLYEMMFLPSPLDSDEHIKSKMDMLENFLSSFSSSIDPRSFKGKSPAEKQRELISAFTEYQNAGRQGSGTRTRVKINERGEVVQ